MRVVVSARLRVGHSCALGLLAERLDDAPPGGVPSPVSNRRALAEVAPLGLGREQELWNQDPFDQGASDLARVFAKGARLIVGNGRESPGHIAGPKNVRAS